MPNQYNSPALKWFYEALKSNDSDECLLWPYTRNHPRGYGQIRFEGRMVFVHRLAFKITHGHWPKPCGCHSCDTPTCFNPRHIFEGTWLDNMRDSVRKGRSGGHRQNPRAKLNPDLVRQIRREYVRGSSTSGGYALARKFGVTQFAIMSIIWGKHWRDVS